MTPEDLRQRGVFVVPALCDGARCARLRAAINSGRATPAEIYVDGYVVDPEVRRTFDVDVDAATLAEVQRIIDGVRDDAAYALGFDLTASEGAGVLRYLQGGFYRAHCDRISDGSDEWPRRVSVVLFLTTAGSGPGAGFCEGGALRLYGPMNQTGDDTSFDIPPVAGTLVAFPATVVHEVLPVTAGVRDAIVDWFY
jgi:predicted 2-oxoglutarate/Fe(II)-dependent dioxygenase YbiX